MTEARISVGRTAALVVHRRSWNALSDRPPVLAGKLAQWQIPEDPSLEAHSAPCAFQFCRPVFGTLSLQTLELVRL